jgi:hypothetical protein
MDDEPRIITVGGQRPAPDVAKWLREQPHHRRITLCCTDEPSVTQEDPTSPSAFRCIDVGVQSLVGGMLAHARVRIADHQASDPIQLITLALEESEAAFADLQAPRGVRISEK